MTNAEYIRSLSDEELANLLSMFCQVSCCGKLCPFDADCPGSEKAEAWLKWLQTAMIM